MSLSRLRRSAHARTNPIALETKKIRALAAAAALFAGKGASPKSTPHGEPRSAQGERGQGPGKEARGAAVPPCRGARSVACKQRRVRSLCPRTAPALGNVTAGHVQERRHAQRRGKRRTILTGCDPIQQAAGSCASLKSLSRCERHQKTLLFRRSEFGTSQLYCATKGDWHRARLSTGLKSQQILPVRWPSMQIWQDRAALVVRRKTRTRE